METRQKPGSHGRRRVVLWAVLIVLAIALVAAAVHLYRVLRAPRSMFQGSDQAALEASPEQAGTAGQTPAPAPTQAPLPEGMVNFLVLGVDALSDGSGKTYSADCHTDTILVAAVDFDRDTVDLISIPRDTFRRVPGSTGYYKINAAVNVGGGADAPGGAGYLRTCETVSEMLGGMPVDYYVALHFDSVIQLVDALGGIDYELEGWINEAGRHYDAGMQHLDGQGVLDYLRVRKSSRTNMDTGDQARVERQKRMLVAIYEKVREQDMLRLIPTLLTTLEGVHTNLNLSQMLALANYGRSAVSADQIRMYTMGGASRQSEDTPWNFVFTDQEDRIALIETVYGVTAEPEACCSYAHLLYLERYGFESIRTQSIVREMCAAVDPDALDAEQRELYEAVLAGQETLQQRMDEAAAFLVETPKPSAEPCVAARTEARRLQKAADAFAEAYGCELPHWWVQDDWWNDTYINDVTVDFADGRAAVVELAPWLSPGRAQGRRLLPSLRKHSIINRPSIIGERGERICWILPLSAAGRPGFPPGCTPCAAARTPRSTRACLWGARRPRRTGSTTIPDSGRAWRAFSSAWRWSSTRRASGLR